jgi:hypothetical protein
MSETNESVVDKVKGFFHEDVKSRTEVQGGVWDAKQNTYTTTDETSGVRTVHTMKKNKSVETGYSVNIKSYKDVTDASGAPKSVEVKFDQKKQKWVEKTVADKAVAALARRPAFMGTLNETKAAGQSEPMRTLTVESAKFKRSPVILVPVR